MDDNEYNEFNEYNEYNGIMKVNGSRGPNAIHLVPMSAINR